MKKLLSNPLVQFGLRALSVGAVGVLTYVGFNAGDVADPATSALVTAIMAAMVNFLHARGAPEV